MSEENIKKQENAVGRENPRRGNVFPFVAALVALVLIVLVVMGFLSSQKLHRQVVVLERQITALEKSGQHTDVRVASLERELALRELQRRRHKIRKVQRSLGGLKPLLAEDPELAGSVRALRQKLRQADKKLKQEINGGSPCRHLSGQSRPAAGQAALPPCLRARKAQGNRAAGAQIQCRNGVCRLVPEKNSQAQPPAEAVAIEIVEEAPPLSAHAAAAATAEAASARPPAQPTWWTRLINWRLFGGN